MPCLWVTARAVRTAYIVDSVPEFVKRRRSRPNLDWNRSAASVADGDGVTNSVPVSIAFVTASTTTGLRCPTSMAPKPIDRSSSGRPSTSVSQAPLAELMEMGYGSQNWNDEVTPRGSTLAARTLWVPDAPVCCVKRSHSSASSWATLAWSIGVDEAGTDRHVAGSCAGSAEEPSEVGRATVVMGHRSSVVVGRACPRS